MDKTTIKADFSIISNELNADNITKMLKILPTYAHNKGSIVPKYKGLSRKKEKKYTHSRWELGTNEEESLHAKDQLYKIIEKMEGKLNLLIKTKQENDNLLYRFTVVVKIENAETPSLYLPIDIIQFAAQIGADFDIDMYVFS